MVDDVGVDKSRMRMRNGGQAAKDALLGTWSVLFVIEKLAMSSVSLKGTIDGERSDSLNGNKVG